MPVTLSRWLAIAFVLAACSDRAKSDPHDAAIDAEACAAPIGFTFSSIGDRSFQSIGTSGVLHDSPIADNVAFGAKVVACDGCNGICSFKGPAPPIGPVNFQRCFNLTSRICTQDSDCPAGVGQACVFIYEPPRAIALVGAGGNIGACTWSYVQMSPPGQNATVSGSLDLASGELSLVLATRAGTNGSSSGSYRGACAECVGDAVANDGKRGGHCVATTRGGASDPSPDLGAACDVHRFGTDPGFEGSYSMDCSPTVQTGDRFPGSLSGGSFTSSGYAMAVTTSSPDCTSPDFAGHKCFCGQCADGTTCRSNLECGGGTCGYLPAGCDPNPYPYRDDGTFNTGYNPAFGPNQCRGAGLATWVASVGNACRNQLCTWDPMTSKGSCISKLTNKPTGCFPDQVGSSVTALGGIRRQGSTLVVDSGTSSCYPFTPWPAPAQVAAGAGQIGIPGLYFQRRSFRITPEYPP